MVCFLPIWQICEVTTIRDSKSALSFVAMKKWKIYANANNTCVEFLKTVCRCSRMYNVSSICVRGKYNDRILNSCFLICLRFHQIKVNHHLNWGYNSYATLKSCHQFFCHVWFFFNIIILLFFFSFEFSDFTSTILDNVQNFTFNR